MSLLRIRAVARRHAYVLQRSPQRWFDVVVWPVVDALLFGAIGVYFARQSSAGAKGAGFLLAGILLFHVVFQAEISLATGFMEETWSRNLLNLMVTPLREVEYVAGVALFGLIKLAMGVGVVALTAFAFYAFDITDLGWSLIPIASILLIVGWVIALFVMGLVLRFGSGAEALAWGILFVVMPLSGVFYPVRSLPWLLRPVAQALPTTHAFNAGRAVIDGRSLPWSELGIATGTTVVAALIGLAFVTRMLSMFRTRGYITRYS